MPTFDNHVSSKIVKALICGESGSGKTGLLATLANSPVIDRILIHDVDNGLDVLRAYVKPENIHKIFYQTYDVTDGRMIEEFDRQVHHWKTPTEDFGPTESLTPRDVVVVDSLSFLGDAARRYALVKAGKKPTEVAVSKELWGLAAAYTEEIVRYLTSDRVKANVIFNTHIRYMEDERGISKMFPQTIGSAFNNKVGRYFNNVFRIDVKADKSRVIRTVADNLFSAKTSNPTKLRETETFDLAYIFDTLTE